jgi:Protein of unknown function (DUF3237)
VNTDPVGSPTLAMPELEFVFEASGVLVPPLDIGPTPRGARRVVDIASGPFKGPRIAGEVAPNGTDWQVVRADGVVEVEARYVLRTDDGVSILVNTRGLRHGPPEAMQAVARGEPVDPTAIYFRVAPVFEAPAGRYEWLNRSLFVGTGMRLPDAIRLRVYRVC